MNVRPNPNPVTQLVFLRDSDGFQNDSWLWPMLGVGGEETSVLAESQLHHNWFPFS